MQKALHARTLPKITLKTASSYAEGFLAWLSQKMRSSAEKQHMQSLCEHLAALKRQEIEFRAAGKNRLVHWVLQDIRTLESVINQRRGKI